MSTCDWDIKSLGITQKPNVVMTIELNKFFLWSNLSQESAKTKTNSRQTFTQWVTLQNYDECSIRKLCMQSYKDPQTVRQHYLKEIIKTLCMQCYKVLLLKLHLIILFQLNQLTVEIMMHCLSCPWNSSTDPTLISDKSKRSNNTRIFSTWDDKNIYVIMPHILASHILREYINTEFDQ